jgi:site-specific recombinase XerD
MKNLIITVYIKDEPSRLKDGKAPVYFKLRTDNIKSTFPANVYVDAKRWKHTNKFTEKKRDSGEITVRDYLNDLISKLNDIEDDFIKAGITYTAQMIKNRILEKDAESLAKNKTLSEAFEFHKNYFMDLVAKGELKKNSYKKYRSVETYINKFITEKHSQTEFPLSNIDNAFQKAFHLYLTGQPKLGEKNTIGKYITLFRCVIKVVTDEGWLKEYPLVDYRMTREKPKKPDVLTVEELQLLIQKDYEDEKLNRVRDYYLFQNMSGLAYADLISLEEIHIVQVGSDYVIMKDREKTDVTATIKLQPEAIEVIKKYAGKNEKNPERCFPYISNKEYNIYVKVCAKLVGIKKHITTHLARHTFGCLMVLNGVDPKARQLAMGHSRQQQTDLYARMFAPQVVNEQNKMDGTFANRSNKHLKKVA